MLKLFTTGPLLNKVGGTTVSEKVKIVIDPLFDEKTNSHCCPCYVVATLFESEDGLEKEEEETKSVILSNKKYSIIEFDLDDKIFEIEIKVFCPGRSPIMNIFGISTTPGLNKLVACHCIKFKDLIAIDTDCCCEDEDRTSDSDEESSSDSCDKRYRPRHNR